MTRMLKHRGPDDSDVATLGSAGLGHTRLSIIDLSPAGHQPMASEDGRITLVYNGELYNFEELRRTLEAQGARFRGRSDSEVFLQAFLQWGTQAFPRFDGMFAAAMWDADTQRLHLVRDRFGIKPLYYYAFDGGLVFGSEIKALLASGKVERALNWQALHEYLYYGHPLGASTMFDGIIELLPGHHLTFGPEGLAHTAYWSLNDIEPVHDTIEQTTRTVRERLEQAVRSHLISDVPVGVFLSGGIDSSAITALASRHYHGRLKTFSVGFDFERGINELPKARMIAERFGTEHHELHLTGGDMPDIIERLVRCHDEPFGDAANIPLFLLCRELKGTIKVILQGDGGDEIFAGYRRYNVLSHEWFWRGAARLAPAVTWAAPARPASYRAGRFFQAMGQSDGALRMALLMTEEPFNDPPTRVMSPEARQRLAECDPFARYREMHRRFLHLDAVQRMLYADVAILLPDQFLEKVDKSTMAHGIEVRVPFLDAHLTDYVLALPSSVKVRNIQKKWILRRALRGIVPDTILDGKKTGFGVPYAHWLRHPLADYMKSVLLDPATGAAALFDTAALRTCIDQHIAGSRNNGFLLYKLLNLALWHQFYLN